MTDANGKRVELLIDVKRIELLGNAGVLPAISLHVYGVESGRIGTHVNRKVDAA